MSRVSRTAMRCKYSPNVSISERLSAPSRTARPVSYTHLLATALGSAYDANGDADAQASQFSRQIGGLRVTVIAKDGTVLGDSAADYKTMENHAGREELKAAEGAGVGISVRPSETLGTRLMYAAVRTQGGEYIRVAMQYNGFLRDLVSLLPALLGAGLVAFAVAAFCLLYTSRCV